MLVHCKGFEDTHSVNMVPVLTAPKDQTSVERGIEMELRRRDQIFTKAFSYSTGEGPGARGRLTQLLVVGNFVNCVPEKGLHFCILAWLLARLELRDSMLMLLLLTAPPLVYLEYSFCFLSRYLCKHLTKVIAS